MRKIFFPFLVLLFLINACATYVDVKVLKPATVDIGDLKNLAVSDFEFVGSWTFDEKEPETIIEIAKEVFKNVLDVGAEAVEPPDLHTAFPREVISAKFITKLLENGHYSVVERDSLYKLLNEQKLSVSGVIKEEDAPKLGEMLGVDAFIFGSGSYSVDDKGGWYPRKNDNIIIKGQDYKIKRKVSVQLTYKIVSVETGKIIASKEHKSTKNVSVKKDTKENALINISDWKPIVDKLTDKLILKSIKQIAPHYTKTSRLIKTGKSTAMKTGLQYAKRNLWDDAKESWETVLNNISPNSIQDRIPAIYNLGVYHEIHDELDKAEELFNQCFKMSGKNEYLDARARIQKRKKEVAELEEQIHTDD